MATDRTPNMHRFARTVTAPLGFALIASLFAGLATTAWAGPVTVEPIALPSFADLAEKVAPAVVSVRVRMVPGQTAQNAPQGGGATPIPPQTGRGGSAIGSGFFISGDGYVVTNNHVVDNASMYTIVTSDGIEHPAKLIGKDDRTDIALLKVEGDATFTYVKWADAPPRIGDWAVAIGNPFGLGGSVTMGIVSARGRTLNSSVYDDYIQIDAPINRGNSGGPTFNLKGEVMGINTAIYSTTGGSVGIAFDIPASTATKIVATLMEKGAVVRGWLGVQTQAVTSTIAASLKLPNTKGAMVADPQPGSPAELAGIKAGDVILSVDGKAIADTRDLAITISSVTPDTLVRVTIWRDGASQEIAVKLGTLQDPTPAPRPANNNNNNGGGNNGGNNNGGVAPGSGRQSEVTPRQGTLVPALGLSLAANGERRTGLDILNVTPNSAAEEAGLSEGDVLLTIAGAVVATTADVETALGLARQNGSNIVMIQVQSGPGKVFVAIPLG